MTHLQWLPAIAAAVCLLAAVSISRASRDDVDAAAAGRGGVGWFLVAPRARAAGLSFARWLVLIGLTGSIGLLAMLARTLWCERRRRADEALGAVRMREGGTT